MMNNKKCMLMILDGWGINPSKEGNAIAIAETPFIDNLFEEYPNAKLLCSGKAVGLPEGIMGNSEVGHLNIGAGRIVYQNLLRIDRSIEDGSFFKNEVLNSVISKVKKNSSALHLMGLVSDGGVHSQLEHLFSLIDMADNNGMAEVYIHVILDGRDTSPDSGVEYVKTLQNYINEKKTGVIATVCGRFYAMDRDTRWDRTEKAFRMYTIGEGKKEKDPVQAVENGYKREETDEFISPVVIVDENENPVGTIKDNDGIIFFNFRADRARQITRAFTELDFKFFKREMLPELCDYVCMTLYDETFTLPMAFPPFHLENIFGEIISEQGLRQLRIAETEKYAHVTYFFNGGEEKSFKYEDRCLVPSPREVATYDLKPEMSAPEIARKAISLMKENDYDLVVLNFANMDMVGHTGIIEAAVKACETIDKCVNKVVSYIKEQGGVVLLTADHGNAEQMIDENGKPHTAHSLNPVPLVLIDDTRKDAELKSGSLKDIAPTILHIMGIEKSAQMDGVSLVET